MSRPDSFVAHTSKAIVAISTMIQQHEERTRRLERSMKEIQTGHQVTLVLMNEETGQPEEVTYALVQVSPSRPVYGRIMKVTSKARISRTPQIRSTYKSSAYRRKVPRRTSSTNIDNRVCRWVEGGRWVCRSPTREFDSEVNAEKLQDDMSATLAKKIARKIIERNEANKGLRNI